MTNLEKYNNAFAQALDLNAEDVKDTLEYQGIPAWDSIGHMGLISELEEAFDIMFETDDIVDFSSYKIGIEILKKYNVEV